MAINFNLLSALLQWPTMIRSAAVAAAAAAAVSLGGY
jgi:hypothetical protein